jgi:hypothetical protein
MELINGMAGCIRTNSFPVRIKNPDEDTVLWSRLTILEERGGPMMLLYKGLLYTLPGLSLRAKIRGIKDWLKLDRPLVKKPELIISMNEIKEVGNEPLLDILYESKS